MRREWDFCHWIWTGIIVAGPEKKEQNLQQSRTTWILSPPDLQSWHLKTQIMCTLCTKHRITEITETFWLKKTCKIIESSHYHNHAKFTTKPCQCSHWVEYEDGTKDGNKILRWKKIKPFWARVDFTSAWSFIPCGHRHFAIKTMAPFITPTKQDQNTLFQNVMVSAQNRCEGQWIKCMNNTPCSQEGRLHFWDLAYSTKLYFLHRITYLTTLHVQPL